VALNVARNSVMNF